MTDERVLTAAQLLERRYGRLDLEAFRSGWEGLVRFVLERALSPKKLDKARSALADSWLFAVDEVAQSTRSDLLELVESHGISSEIVALLHRLAIWWQRELDEGRTPLQPNSAGLEEQWEELSARDRNWITRIFCVIGGLNKFPLSRGIWRVACRHGWLSWHDAAEEVSGFYESAAADQPYEPGQLAEWFLQLGDDYCGPKPKCVGCPLESLLGPNGPSEPEY